MTAKTPRKEKTTRKDHAEKVLQSIFDAALKVVGKYGYGDASISRITDEAGIAQGTFYLYFDSRQALFDQLLPHVGREMLLFVGRRVKGAESFYEVEERGFRAFFAYVAANPGFMRVLNEAEAFAPQAHKAYFQLVTRVYKKSLKRSIDKGEIRNFDEQELVTLSYMLMAMRPYLYLRYVKSDTKPKKIPDAVVETFMKVLRGGIR